MQRVPITHESIQLRVEACFRLWEMFGLAESVSVEFSGRLRVALGRTNVVNHHVRLNLLLEEKGQGLLDEVLCHELAHIAVYERFGSAAKPHGKEWAELMQKAGYEPRVRIGIDGDGVSKQSRKYEHICPVCQSVRYAGRAMTRWRCGACTDAGLDGQLLIRSIADE
jgi:SprT protein